MPAVITPFLSLEVRVALVWIRDHRFTTPPHDKVPQGLRYRLLQSGLIEFDPKRDRFSPVTYHLTDAGQRVLDPLS